MKLDTDPFSVGMVKIEHKKILVRIDQAKTIKGKNVVISDDLRNWMIKPHNPEIGVWKDNVQRKPAKRVKPTSAMLIENISGSYRKVRGTRSPEGSNGIDSSRLRTDPIYRRCGMVGCPREGRRSSLEIRNLG
jgi:hypothetical protein